MSWSQFSAGALVRICSVPPNKQPMGSSYVGRIGMLIRKDADGAARVYCYPGNVGLEWRIVDLALVGKEDEAKQDVKFIADLRVAFQRVHPELVVDNNAAAIAAAAAKAKANQETVKRIKILVADIRAKLTDLERAAAEFE